MSNKTLRVMTYNVHSCLGMDGVLNVERIAHVIAKAKADVVALQELDVGRMRSANVDQAHRIAQLLGMYMHFHPAMLIEEERYGDAILTQYPLRVVRAAALPGLVYMPKLEPRGALWVAIDFEGLEIQVINTHLGLLPHEQWVQAQAILGREWLEHDLCRKPVIVCGDFNVPPWSPIYRKFNKPLYDVQIKAPHHLIRNTFSARFPVTRIDHIFVNREVEVARVQVPRTHLERAASDHLPLIADIRYLA